MRTTVPCRLTVRQRNRKSDAFSRRLKAGSDGKEMTSGDIVSDIAIFVLKRDVKLQLTN